MGHTGAVQALLVSDLHYALPKLDWVLGEAEALDLLVVAGDLLDVGSAVPLDAQITVVLEYLARCADATTTVVCSGNHDLDHRGDDGEKATRWITEAADRGVVADGARTEVGGWLVSSCAWWEGPSSLARLEAALADDAAERGARPWLWAWHGPPEGPLSSTGTRHFGDPELPRLVDEHHPDVVLCGHIHQAPYVDDGGWCEERDGTWLFNSGFQPGAVPAHTFLSLPDGDALAADPAAPVTAEWWSFQGSGQISFPIRAAAYPS